MIHNYLLIALRTLKRDKLFAALNIIGLATGAEAFGQLPSGRYAGAITRDGSIQSLSFTFNMAPGHCVARYDIPDLGIYDVACDSVVVSGDSLFVRFFYGSFVCRYFPLTRELTGRSEGWVPEIRMHLKPAERLQPPYVSTEITFNNGGVRLVGSLFAPRVENAFPVVIMIHGSDAQDRQTWYYRSLGWTLAERGIGVFLYDKRGCGASSGSMHEATFDDLADDAVAAYHTLKGDERFKISCIGYLGTSQGGWIAPMAALRSPDCAFMVLNAGPSVAVFDQDIHRVRYSMEADGYATTAVDSAVEYTNHYFNYVRSGDSNDRKALELMAAAIRGRDWSQYVNLDLGEADLAWWRAHDHDPAATLSSLRCPTLSIFGELDPLVPPKENVPRMQELLASANIDHRIVVLQGCGHDARTFQGLNGEDWDWPAVYWQWRRQPPEFINSIADWVIRYGSLGNSPRPAPKN